MSSKIPKALSEGEETFDLHCRVKNLTNAEREYKFHPTRKWMFDFAWPAIKLAVEVEGGTKFGKSRHSRGSGFEGDCEKYNAAIMLGWRILRYTTDMVLDGTAINQVVEYIESVN